MAQFAAQDGGSQQGPFGYSSTWMGEAGFEAPMATSVEQNLLVPQDMQFLSSFFADPDASISNDAFPGLNWDTEQRGGNADFAGQLEGFDNNAQTVHNPAVTLSGHSGTSYLTHAGQQHARDTDNAAEDFEGSHASQVSEELKAASGLFSMSTHGQDQSRGPPFDTPIGGSWGSFGMINPAMPSHDQLQSPLTSSGRQSANAFNGHEHLSHNHSLDSQMRHHHMPYNFAQFHGAPTPSATGPSSQMDAGFWMYPNHHQQTPVPHSANSLGQTNLRSAPISFGSDTNFSSGPYRASHDYLTQEQQREANLNNVPFARQLQAHAQANMPSQGSANVPRSMQRYSMPSHFPIYQRPGSLSNLRGLPTMGSVSAVSPHGHPLPVPQHQVRAVEEVQQGEDEDDDDEDDEEDAEEVKPPSRKRRKSQMEREEEAAYRPSAAEATPLPRRSSKATKNADLDGSDEESYIPPAASANPAKRRKSNGAARRLSGPSGSLSPEDGLSDTNTPNSSRKKKGSKVAVSRRNLTEEEKRQNHIKSEKNRRDIIKQQWDEFHMMVPALKGGRAGLSKSDGLNEIIAFIETLVAGNARVEAAIKAATANGGHMPGDERGSAD